MPRCWQKNAKVLREEWHGADRIMPRCWQKNATVLTEECQGAERRMARCWQNNATLLTEECQGADRSRCVHHRHRIQFSTVQILWCVSCSIFVVKCFDNIDLLHPTSALTSAACPQPPSVPLRYQSGGTTLHLTKISMSMHAINIENILANAESGKPTDAKMKLHAVYYAIFCSNLWLLTYIRMGW
jgi:hypothetical protein